MKKEGKNFLDLVPAWNPAYTWDIDQEGNVVVHVIHKGFYSWIAHKCFHRPKISHISLDRYGSFVWLAINGEANVYEISKSVQSQFGAEAEPVLERLVRFLQILYQNGFVGYVK